MKSYPRQKNSTLQNAPHPLGIRNLERRSSPRSREHHHTLLSSALDVKGGALVKACHQKLHHRLRGETPPFPNSSKGLTSSCSSREANPTLFAAKRRGHMARRVPNSAETLATRVNQDATSAFSLPRDVPRKSLSNSKRSI